MIGIHQQNKKKIIKGEVCVCYLIKQKFLEGKTWSSALRRAHVCVCENVGQKTRNKFFLKYKNCGSDNWLIFFCLFLFFKLLRFAVVRPPPPRQKIMRIRENKGEKKNLNSFRLGCTHLHIPSSKFLFLNVFFFLFKGDILVFN